MLLIQYYGESFKSLEQLLLNDLLLPEKVIII